MNKSKHTGTKLSEYPTGLTDKRYKLLYNHYFMSYAPVNFGISTVNKNYKIPIQALRNDIKYYIGLENAKGDWQNMIHFWSGDWFNENNKTKSYIYDWKYEERGSSDYISNKFGNKTDNEGNAIDDFDRIFFIKDAPIPLEEKEHKDPAPESNKFVNKKYIDDRFNGIRKVTVDDTKLEIRPYPCVYEYSAMPSSINIVDTLTLEDGRTIKDCIENNCLIFYIKLPTPKSTTLSVKANTVDTKWGFSGELTQLLSTAKKNADSGLIKCYAEYIDGTFTVHCTNGMNLKPGEGGTVEIDTTDTIVDGSDAVPTSNAVYDHVKLHEDKNIHITDDERTSWNENVTNTTNHVNDKNIHVTLNDKNTWNTHKDDTTKHITSSERTSWNENVTNTTNHINNSDIHITDVERTSWNNNITNTTNHINNSDIHVTDDERTSWNNKIDNVIGDTFIDSYRNDNNITLTLNTTEEIIDSDVHVPTSAAVYDAIHNSTDHKTWHDDNGLKHVELYNFNFITVEHTNQSTGVRANGFILSLPHLTKLTKLLVYGYYSSFGYPPSGGNSDFELYLKLVDKKSGHVLAVSNKAEKQDNTVGTAVFTFNEDNQFLIPKNTEIKAIFSSNNDFHDSTNDKSFLIAYADSSKKLFTETVNDEKIPRWSGEFTPKYITSNGDEKEAPEQFTQRNLDGSSTTINCIGMAVVPYGVFNKTIEFNDIAAEALKIYQHTNEQNQYITDKYYQDAGVKDLTQMGTSTFDVQGIAYVQICSDTYGFTKNSFLTSVQVPQNYSGTDYTNDNVYLVIYGDTTANDDWVFVASSKNSQLQKAGGNDMIFYFEKGIDLGDYKRCRFFYSLTNEGEIPLPTTGENYNGVRMAFKALVIDTNCWIKQTNSTGNVIYNRAFPAIISYATEEMILHKDNEERHITQEEKDRWNEAADRIAELETTIATLTTQLSQLTAQN